MDVKPFRCPACNASLEPGDTGKSTIRCEYCNTSMIVPEALRQATSRPGDDLLDAIGPLLAEGRKIEAIKIYREQSGVGLKQAKEAVEALQRGEAVALDPVTPAQPESSQGCSLPLLLLLLLVGGGIYLGWSWLNQGAVPFGEETQTKGDDGPATEGSSGPVEIAGGSERPADIPAGSGAEIEVLAEGEGNGPGFFQDSRFLALDNEGQIYVGDFDGGRVQQFAADGTPRGQWFSEGQGIMGGLVAGPAGTLYLLEGGEVQRYERASGRRLGTVADVLPSAEAAALNEVRVEAIAPTGDGGLAIIGDGLLLRLDRQGEPALLATGIFEGVPVEGPPPSVRSMAVDGANTLYLHFTFEDPIYRFDAEGRYVDRFGRRGDGPGDFTSPTAVATDGRGRVLVEDFGQIMIFEGDGTFVEAVDVEGAAFALHVRDGHLYRLDRNGNRLVRTPLTW